MIEQDYQHFERMMGILLGDMLGRRELSELLDEDTLTAIGQGAPPERLGFDREALLDVLGECLAGYMGDLIELRRFDD